MRDVTVFLGCHGGAGTTSAALRAAVSGSRASVLLELDLWAGPLATRLGIVAPSTLADLARLPADELPSTDAIAAVTYGIGRDAWCIPGPCDPHDADVVDPPLVRRVLEVLVGRGAYEEVVVDAGSRIDATSWEACRVASEVVLVASAARVAEGGAESACRLLAHACPHVRLTLELTGARPRRAHRWCAEHLPGVDLRRSMRPRLGPWLAAPRGSGLAVRERTAP